RVHRVDEEIDRERDLLALDRVEKRPDLDEGEAAPDGEIHARDGAVGGVARREDVELRIERERLGEALWYVGQADLSIPLARLEEDDRLAEHAAEVGAVDLVDHEDVLAFACG